MGYETWLGLRMQSGLSSPWSTALHVQALGPLGLGLMGRPLEEDGRQPRKRRLAVFLTLPRKPEDTESILEILTSNNRYPVQGPQERGERECVCVCVCVCVKGQCVCVCVCVCVSAPVLSQGTFFQQ